MIKQRLLRQFPNPQGPLGWVAGTIMRRRSVNVERTRATVALLGLETTDRVLEIGHGPGIGLAAALERAASVVGVEQSSTMNRMAVRHNRSAIRDRRLTLLVADGRRPEADIGRFDAIFSCNVWQFWDDPADVLAAWRTHLVDGGRMAVTYRPPQLDARSTDALEAGDRITDQFAVAGYRDIRMETIDFGEVPAVCVLGNV